MCLPMHGRLVISFVTEFTTVYQPLDPPKNLSARRCLRCFDESLNDVPHAGRALGYGVDHRSLPELVTLPLATCSGVGSEFRGTYIIKMTAFWRYPINFTARF